MTEQEYDQELTKLLEEGGTPTKEFCEYFLDRCGEAEDIMPDEYIGGDSEDYHTWGFAFFGDIDQSGEQAAYKIKIWDHIEHYGLL